MAYHIFVVEDEPDTRELLDFTLWWNGHHVDTARDGREALTLLAEHSYDVILLRWSPSRTPLNDFYK